MFDKKKRIVMHYFLIFEKALRGKIP